MKAINARRKQRRVQSKRAGIYLRHEREFIPCRSTCRVASSHLAGTTWADAATTVKEYKPQTESLVDNKGKTGAIPDFSQTIVLLLCHTTPTTELITRMIVAATAYTIKLIGSSEPTYVIEPVNVHYALQTSSTKKHHGKRGPAHANTLMRSTWPSNSKHEQTRT